MIAADMVTTRRFWFQQMASAKVFLHCAAVFNQIQALNENDRDSMKATVLSVAQNICATEFLYCSEAKVYIEVCINMLFYTHSHFPLLSPMPIAPVLSITVTLLTLWPN